MWRAFGNDTSKVGIVFRIPKFSGAAIALSLMFSPVAYLSEAEIHGLIYRVIDSINNNGSIFEDLAARRNIRLGIYYASQWSNVHKA
jgi:K+-transporting ATPase A subunit